MLTDSDFSTNQTIISKVRMFIDSVIEKSVEEEFFENCIQILKNIAKAAES